MKKIIAVLAFIAVTTSVFAQSNCAALHRIFAIPTDKVPVVVTKLGVSPQFEMCVHVTDGNLYFKNLKSLANNPRHKDEINTLFRAIGYKGGVSDPAFTRDKIEATTIPFGAIGNLGDGRHNYIYAILALTGQKNIKCWRIKSANNCNLYIMDECGNAFYYSNPPIERETIRYVERCTGNAKLKVRVIARYHKEEEFECNDCEGTTYEKEELKELSLADDKIDNIPIGNAKSRYPVKTIYIDLDKHTFRKLEKYTQKQEECGDDCCEDDCDASCTDGCEKGQSCTHGSNKSCEGSNKKCDKK
jgi:hypothetical protein